MSDSWTYSTVAIEAADQAAAQADYPAYFMAGFSADGTAPATHYVTSGPFDNEELSAIINVAAWPKRVEFGSDAQAALVKLGLVAVNSDVDNQSVV